MTHVPKCNISLFFFSPRHAEPRAAQQLYAYTDAAHLPLLHCGDLHEPGQPTLLGVVQSPAVPVHAAQARHRIKPDITATKHTEKKKQQTDAHICRSVGTARSELVQSSSWPQVSLAQRQPRLVCRHQESAAVPEGRRCRLVAVLQCGHSTPIPRSGGRHHQGCRERHNACKTKAPSLVFTLPVAPFFFGPPSPLHIFFPSPCAAGRVRNYHTSRVELVGARVCGGGSFGHPVPFHTSE